jgi:hypothetical protein
MPLQKLQFRPGLNREGTDYSNEGGWYDGNQIRFRSGFPEKIGGWVRFVNSYFIGICRSLWQWVDVNGSSSYIGLGTNVKYYVDSGGSFFDITPYINNSAGTNVTTLTANPFSATSGSNIITVSDTVSGITPNPGDYVVFTSTASVGGLSIVGEYQVATVLNTTTYTFTSPVNATSTGTGGGTVTVSYELPVGNIVGTVGNGWGAGAWSPTTPTYLANNPFATTASSGVVTVTYANHGLTSGEYCAFLGATAVANVPATMLNDTFQVTVVSSSSFTITLPSGFTATSTATGGGAQTIAYPQFGTRPWGSAATSGISSQLRLWTQDNFGADLVMAPRGGPIFYWQDAGGVGTRAQYLSTLATAAGQPGTYVPTTTNQVLVSPTSDIVIAFGCNPYVSGTPNTPFNPMLVRWSDALNAYNWVPALTNQAGDYTLTRGSFIMGARNTRQEILVWTNSALYSMQYIGAPYVYGFNLLMDNISILSPNAMITINNVTYWIGNGKFYQYSGTVQTLPCSLRQYIFDDINLNQAFQVFAGSNESFNEIWWFYVSNEAPNNQIDSYVVYNYLDQVWYYGKMSRSFWYQSGIQQGPLATNYLPNATFTGTISGNILTVTQLASGSISLDVSITGTGVTPNTVITGYGTGTGGLGTYTVSIFQSVASTAMVTNGNIGYLLEHEEGVDDVAGLTARPIDAYVQSSDFDIGDGHNFGFVWRILPDVNFNGSNVNAPYVTMTVKPRENSGSPYGQADNPQVTSSNNYTTFSEYTIQTYTGQVYTRLRGRQMAFRIESNSLGVAWQLGSPRIDIRPDGRR